MRNLSRNDPGQEKERDIVGDVSVTKRRADQDSTRRGHLEDALRENIELFEGVFNQAAVGIALTSPDRKVVQANQKICEFLGYEFEDLFGKTLWSATHPDFIPQVDEHIRKLVDGEVESATIENLYVRKDGTTVWGEWTSSLIRDEHGAPKFFISVIQNIDDRKKAEAEAQKTAEMLENSQRIAHLGSWDLDIAEDKERWSDEVYRIFGLEPQSIDFNGYGFLDYVHPEDREKAKLAQDESLAQHKPYSVEYRLRRPDGVERTVYEHAELEYDDQGTPVRLSGTIQDVTELKQAEGKLRETTRRLELAQKQAKIGHWRWSFAEERLTYWSTGAAQISQYPVEQGPMGYDEMLAAVHPDDRQRVEAEYKAADEERRDFSMEYRVVHKDGHITHVREMGEVEYDEGGMPVAHIGIVQDITELRQVEHELRASEQRLDAFFAEAPAGLALYDEEGRFIRVNETLARVAGVPAAAHVGKRPSEVLHADWARQIEEANRQVLETGAQQVNVEFTAPIPTAQDEDGRYVFSRFPIPGAEGKPSGVGSIVVDITERKRAEDAVRNSEELLRLVTDTIPALVSYVDVDRRYGFVNKEYERRYGIAPEDMVGMRMDEVLGTETFARMKPYVDRAFSGEKVTYIDDEFDREGNRWCTLETRVPHFVRAGKVDGIVTVAVDITELKNVEDALRIREQQLTEAQHVGHIGHWRLDVKKREYTYWSDELYRILGVDKDSFLPTLDNFLALIHEDDLQASIENREAALAERRPYQYEYRIVRPSGEIRDIRGEARPEFDENGEPTMVFGISQDVTEVRQRESELRQAQKMDMVGQLTGGVAHDFNNILAIILGNLELLQDELVCDYNCKNQIEMAIKATERGANLTQRLLAFSRKQALRPVPVDARKLVGDMLDLLQRSLGETIEIKIVAEAGLWATEIDPGQLESALLNLVINARDAMPDGGKLTIEVSNAKLTDEYAAARIDVESGCYLLVSVRDTGTGMTPEVRDKVFDPFFTTKEAGKGTGLGLSMVHGFVKQSGGHIAIDSEVGVGTAVKLYLPRYRVKKEAAKSDGQTDESTSGAGEVILVVEDDLDLRALIVNMLQPMGYRVLASGTGKGALEVLAKTADVNLLLTDVVLPGGMSGRELSDRVREKDPDMPILYMSGYTEDAIIHHGRLDEGVQLLEKPFRQSDLAQAVRKVLDSEPV